MTPIIYHKKTHIYLEKVLNPRVRDPRSLEAPGPQPTAAKSKEWRRAADMSIEDTCRLTSIRRHQRHQVMQGARNLKTLADHTNYKLYIRPSVIALATMLYAVVRAFSQTEHKVFVMHRMRLFEGRNAHPRQARVPSKSSGSRQSWRCPSVHEVSLKCWSGWVGCRRGASGMIESACPCL